MSNNPNIYDIARDFGSQVENEIANEDLDPYFSATILILAARALKNDSPNNENIILNTELGGIGYTSITGDILLRSARSILTSPHVDPNETRTMVLQADLEMATAEGALTRDSKVDALVRAVGHLLNAGPQFKGVYEDVLQRLVLEYQS